MVLAMLTRGLVGDQGIYSLYKLDKQYIPLFATNRLEEYAHRADQKRKS